MRMSREMYESLQIKDLRAIAESRGLSVGTRPRKETLVKKLLQLDQEEDEKALGAGSAAPAADAGSSPAEAPAPQSENDASEAAQQPSADGDPADAAPIPAPESKAAKRSARPARDESRPARQSRAARRNSGAPEPAPESAAAAAPSAAAAAPSAVPAPQTAADAATVQTQPASQSASPAQQSPRGQNQNLSERYARRGLSRPDQQIVHKNELNPELDSGEIAHGILEVMGDGFGFIRSNNYMPGENDVYVAPSQIRRFSLKTGDIVEGNIRVRSQNEKFSALLYVKSVNGMDPEVTKRRFNFEDMTPIFPDERIRLERPGASIAMRVMDLMCPVGKGQRGMIVSPPKAGKTTLLKEVARSVKAANPHIHLIILLIDERPEEVTDLREALEGPNVEVIYSTFDELPEHHKRVAEMTIERAKRLVEHREDVMILLDSITRLTRAYNLTEPSSGRTLSGGLDPVALHMPKRFFGAARNMREGGSLTILATALIETGSKMDDVVYEEFKGTGNMEMILNRKLSERRIFPAVDLAKSGTRRDDLLLTPDEQEAVATIRRAFIGSRGEEATDSVLDLFSKTRTNGEFVNMVRKHMWSF